MKKLNIGFILLLCLFTFVPQIVNANMTYEMTKFYKEQGEKAKEKYSECLKEYKSKLPKKYKGPNLKPEYLGKLGIKLGEYVFVTENEYFIDSKVIYRDQKDFEGSFIKTNSVASSCNKEYVNTWINTRYNVIDVPPGSCLKFNQDTNEIEIITPTDKEYKNLIKYVGFYTKERVKETPEPKTFFDKIKEKFKNAKP